MRIRNKMGNKRLTLRLMEGEDELFMLSGTTKNLANLGTDVYWDSGGGLYDDWLKSVPIHKTHKSLREAYNTLMNLAKTKNKSKYKIIMEV